MADLSTLSACNSSSENLLLQLLGSFSFQDHSLGEAYGGEPQQDQPFNVEQVKSIW